MNWVCRSCHRVYWQASHWHRLQRLIRSALGDTGPRLLELNSRLLRTLQAKGTKTR
ncbi:MAG: Mut7-C RNAse domain-containing protein [Gammaproteobacteria bacterium]